MYEIYADDLLIHSDITPLETHKVVNPHLTLEDSAAGSLEFVLPPINVGYEQDKIKRMTTDIVVRCDGEFLWGGRVLQDSYDFWNNRKIMCEGELAFLNDSIQPPHKYNAYEPGTESTVQTTIESFFYSLIDIHNLQVEERRQFKKGMVTVMDGDVTSDSNAIYRFTNYETTLGCINDKLVERLKGHIRIRHIKNATTGKYERYLDYISDNTLDTNTQVVRFGINLLDFSKNIDMSELATVLVPRGERLDLKEGDPDYIEGLEPYLTVKDVETKIEDGKTWHTQGEIFVNNPDAVATFGRICTVVDWSDVTDANTLYSKAKKYLEDEQYEKMTLEIQALDLKYLLNGDDPIKFLSKLRCISEPHGMDHTFIVSKMDLDLSNPSNCTYTLGTDVKLSLTQAASKTSSVLLEEIEKIPSKNSILNAARENAFEILMGEDGGYVRFEKYDPEDPHYNPDNPDIIHAIVISNGPTDEESTRKWVWNEGGLGHFQRPDTETPWASSYGPDDHGYVEGLNVAITMDGRINCNALYGGWIYGQHIEGCTIHGNTITGGSFHTDVLTSNGGSIDMREGSLHITNSADNYLRLTSNGHGPWESSDCEVTLGGYTWSAYDRSSRPFCHPVDIFNDYDVNSDIRIKKDIEDINDEVSKELILNAKLHNFRYKKKDTEQHWGIIAQEVLEQLDKLGYTVDDTKIVNIFDGTDMYRVDYKEYIPHLMRMIQIQQKQIEALQNK